MANKLDFTPWGYKSADLAHAFGFLTPLELFTIRVFAAALPEYATIANIGAGAGTSTLGMRESNKTANIYTIDISEGGPCGGLQNEINAFKNAGINHDTIQILGNSHDVKFDKPIDLLFVDGDHSYDGCMGDLIKYAPLVKKGGYILVHDYERDVWPAVKKACDDYEKKSCIFHIGNFDTIVVYKK